MTALDLRPAPAPDRAAAPAARSTRRRRTARLPRVLVALGLLVIAAAHSLNLAGWPRWFDDEGTYYSQAWAVQHLGSLAPYTYWYDHPPVGWLQLAAFTWLPDLLLDGSSSELLSGRIVMVGYTVVSAGLLYMLARRLGMRSGWALAAMLLWGLNPLVIFEGRQVFLDTVALPWLIGAFVLALNRRHELGLHMAAGFAFGIAVLSKETTLVFAPALVLAIWQNAYRPTRSFALMGFAAATAMTGAMYVLFALVRSELFPSADRVSLWEALAFQFFEREGSGFVLDPNGPEGGAYETFTNWMRLDPFLLTAGVLAAAVCLLLVRRLRPVGVAVLLAALVALRPGGYLPQMYVIAVLPFCALAVVGLLDTTWQRAAGLRGRGVAYGAGFAVLLSLLGWALPAARWADNYVVAWQEDANEPHRQMLQSLSRLPDGVRIAADNTFWNDLVAAGRSRDDVVWFFKVDQDAQVLDDLGGSHGGLDYLVWSRYVAENAGPVVDEAYARSIPVASHGSGRGLVELREVLDPAEWAQREQARAEALAQRLAAEQEAREAFFARESTRFPGLTNGQIEGIVLDSGSAGTAELARKYATTQQTIRAVLSDPPPRDRADESGR